MAPTMQSDMQYIIVFVIFMTQTVLFVAFFCKNFESFRISTVSLAVPLLKVFVNMVNTNQLADSLLTKFRMKLN